MALLRATGPAGSVLVDALLDTGADDTVLPEQVAPTLGIDLTQASQSIITLAGRGPVVCHFTQVTLWLSNGLGQAYEWKATVGFVPVLGLLPLLGHAGCLQFFDANFLGADREAILLPNRSFTGRQI
jgi:hypothetical protein